MDRSEATNVAVSSALLGTGGIALAIVIPLAAGVQPHPWTASWFLAPACFFGALGLVGFYGLMALYTGWPLPVTAVERELAAELHIEPIQIEAQQNGAVRFQVGLRNDGGSDIANATVNIVVPSFIRTMYEADYRGVPARKQGNVTPTAESIQRVGGQDLPSIFWSESLGIPAGAAMPRYFVVEFDGAPQVFEVRVRIRAAALGRKVALAWATLTPPAAPSGSN